MIVVAHVTKHYDWEPVPQGVTVTQKDLAAGKAKPAIDGRMLMRVKRDRETHVMVTLPEHEIIAEVVHGAVRDKVQHTRSQAVALYLSRRVMEHFAHPTWMRSFEVSGDGPDEALLRATLVRYTDAGLIEDESVEDLVEAYMTEHTNEDVASHLVAHFGVKETA